MCKQHQAEMCGDARLCSDYLTRERRLHRVDNHHILFEGRFWAQDVYLRLRSDSSLITIMDRRMHTELHNEVPPVPPLGSNLTMRVEKFYRRLKDRANPGADDDWPPVMGITLLNMALDQVVACDRITDLEVAQIELIKANLGLQLQFIMQSDELIENRMYEAIGRLVVLHNNLPMPG